MKIEDFANHHLSDIYNLLDKAEEKNPEVAEELAKTMGLKILKRWQEIKENYQKRSKLTNINNVN